MVGDIDVSHYLLLQLPDKFKDFVMNNSGGNTLSGALMTHCHPEILHAQWQVLLNEDFINACQHGVVITWCNGVKHCFYSHIFTYSADFVDRVLIACIHNLGTCPCPHCMIRLNEVQDLGNEKDLHN